MEPCTEGVHRGNVSFGEAREINPPSCNIALKTPEGIDQLSKNLFRFVLSTTDRLKAFVWNGLAFRKDLKFIEVFHVESLESAACCLVPRSGKGIIKRIRVN